MSEQDSKSKPAPLTTPEPERMSPQDCAARLGCIGSVPVPSGGKRFTDYRHNMARMIHGWGGAGEPGGPIPAGGYEYHEGGPILLTIADYKAALRAAEKFPYTPHKPAMTKYAPAEYRKASA